MTISLKTRENFNIYIYAKLYEVKKLTFTGSDYSWIDKLANSNGSSAIDCFDSYDNKGININCSPSEINDLKKAIIGKASLNFHIKLWSQAISNGLLTIDELKEDYGDHLPEWVYNIFYKITTSYSYKGNAMASGKTREDFMNRFSIEWKSIATQ